MSAQDFAQLVEGGRESLLRQVESIVVDAHRRWYESLGKTWSEPVAYQWLHYEDPDPISRLRVAVQRLSAAEVAFSDAPVARAELEAGRVRKGRAAGLETYPPGDPPGGPDAETQQAEDHDAAENA